MGQTENFAKLNDVASNSNVKNIVPLITYYSNRLEILAAELATLVSKPLRSPFDEEIIIVQSNGMARWLSMYLAQNLGISANVRFPFPSGFLWEILRQLLSDVPETSSYDRPILTWRIMELLQNLDNSSSYASVRAYLKDADELRYFELARRIADSFDQYLVYRPDWINDWEKKQNEHGWQTTLWQQLVKRDKEPHRVKLQNRFLLELSSVSAALAGLPERVALLGVSALPPIQLELLAQLADIVEVHLFLLNPCQEYWGDIVADRDVARRGAEIDPADQYLEVGNPLLASLGKQGRDFIDLIQQYPVTSYEYYQAPAEVNLLSCLQSDILHLHRRGENTPKTPIAEDDHSLQVHACHSPMREIEVLHDQLLALFEASPELTPADIVVMTPDIEAYSPAIEAVFDTIRGERRIPYSIADRSPLYENPHVDAFLQLLDLPNSRYQVNQLLALLEIPAIRQCFLIDEDDLRHIQHWLQITGIRWGIDSASRAALELPAMHEHSWRAGLERLLLGYALPGAGTEMYHDILPYDDVEGSGAEIMGGLQSFAESVFRLRSLGEQAQPISVWVRVLHQIIEDFFAPKDTEQEQLQPIRSALEKLEAYSQGARYIEPVSLQVIRAALQLELTETAGPGGFFSGGVTFCTLVPMRSIPFQVICLIGMNNDTYPRPHRPPDFDLMLQDIRKGDRSRRQDDRYLFLEALISARHCLYLSYVGSNIHDNSVIPPSVLVSELLDVIDQGFCTTIGPAQDQVVSYHPLQAFSQRYFAVSNRNNSRAENDYRLFSYSQELAELSRQSAQTRTEPPAFISGTLPEAELQWRQLDVEQLIRFFHHPVRFLLRERLNIQLQTDIAPLPDHEPFLLDGLSNYQLREQLLNLQLAEKSAQQAESITRGGGILPHGEIGATVFTREWDSVDRFARRLQRFLPDAEFETLAVDITLAEIRIFGQLQPICKQGFFGYRLGLVTARDYLRLWLQHLLLNILAPADIEPSSHWLGQDQELVLRPVAQAEYHLETLLHYYWRGLHAPLPFFPKTSFAYIEAAANNRSKTSPEHKAQQVWEGNERTPGEANDPYYRLAFRACDPLDEAFISVTESIIQPIFAHLGAAE